MLTTFSDNLDFQLTVFSYFLVKIFILYVKSRYQAGQMYIPKQIFGVLQNNITFIKYISNITYTSMPPKTKKDSEEQAKRLEEERKRKQEQQARLQLQRKKYLSQKLSTGLFLPASNQLIIDYAHKAKDFISQKLKLAIKEGYPAILQSKRLQFVLKELHYFIKDSYQLFGSVKQGSIWTKHRIFIGIMLTILLNNDAEGTGEKKNRLEDEKKAKQLITTHCNKIEGSDCLTKKDGLIVLTYAKQKYFSRFQLLKMFDKFVKKQTQQKFPIYLETPNTYFNEDNTVFTDLSKPIEQQKAKSP